MELSIIIPAYEENSKVKKDIKLASDFLISNDITGEVIIVDDGSKDNTYKNAVNAAQNTDCPVEVIRLEQNLGKGGAVRAGVIKSQGKYVMFSDSGCCIPYETALIGIEMIKTGRCDIAHGSRKMTGCHIIRQQSQLRRICSKLFRFMINVILKIPHSLTDTQCGFKIYRGDVARDIYSICRTNGFVFDVETILIALKKGYVIKEFPVDWTCDCDSRISLRKTSFKVLREIFAIKKRVKNHKDL